MNYELAKELKDAGFPQRFINPKFYVTPEAPSWAEHDDEVRKNGIGNVPWTISVPTLSELIDACGLHFRYLDRGKTDWHAHGASNPSGDAIVVDIHTQGLTPEEAVARLWLALNKK